MVSEPEYSLNAPGGCAVTSLFQQEMSSESGYSSSWSRQATKEHHFVAKVRPSFTHPKAAKQVHGGGEWGQNTTVWLSKTLL